VYENIQAKQCPKCGWTCAQTAHACIRCKYEFPGSTQRQLIQTTGRVTVVGGLILAFAAFAALFYITHVRVVSTPAYQEGIRIAESSANLRTVLGDQITPRSLATGLVVDMYGSRFVEWEVTLGGSRGRAHLYGVANELGGTLEFSRLTAIDSSRKRIDLTPKPTKLSLPSVPVKKVYLVPFGLDDGESLDWAPAYYQAKLGIEVFVLSPLPVDESVVDAKRHQLDGEKCLDYARKKHPELWADPSAILVAVTSRDMFIRSFRWAYAENLREDSRYALVSSARLQPASLLNKWNPEWLASRREKMLTKNIAILYFDLPMSSDYTSLLSGGVLSGSKVDCMTGLIIGAEGKWDPFIDEGEPQVAIYDEPGKPLLWHMGYSLETLPDTSAQVFGAYLESGIFMLRQNDFRFDGEYALELKRAYDSQDDHSRAFGIGAMHSLDIILVGQMGSHVDLMFEDGDRVRFEHSAVASGIGDTYVATSGDYTTAVYAGDTWTVTRRDGWKFYFPYRPTALPDKVTVLTGFADPGGHLYRMERDSLGVLLSVVTPGGQWLHFENDSGHRIRRIEASTGRVVNYEYDGKGCLSRVSDSEGHVELYTYNDRGQMLTAAHGANEAPVLTNKYNNSGNIKTQTMADGQKFQYHYFQDSSGPGRGKMVPDLITYPSGLVTYIRYGEDGYIVSLPTRPPYERRADD
jgi:YD repeat-containing protein